MDFWQYHSKYLKRFIKKIKSLQILICSQLQAKHLVMPREEKEGNNDGRVKSFATKYWCRATKHPNIKPISFEIG